VSGSYTLQALYVAPARIPPREIIMMNCRETKSILTRLEKADISTRLNRGADYDKLLSLMFAMNARLASNKIAAPELADITAQFGSEVAEFRSNYDIYNDDLGKANDIDCYAKPIEFYERLENIRRSRAKLHENVKHLRQLADDYIDGFEMIVEAL